MSEVEALLARAEHLSFFELVARLEQARPGSAALGGDGPFSEEALRFRHDPALTFHTGDVRSAVLNAHGHVELTTTFAGLTGSTSPLPASFLEQAAREDDDGQLERDFLDIFHHRLLSLFYRGRRKFDLTDGASAHAAPQLLSWLLGLAGLPAGQAEAISGLELALLLRLLPLLVSYPANAERIAVAIRAVFADVLGEATVSVRSMTGGHVPIDASARARLGVDFRLGRTSTLGARAPLPASGITVRLHGLRPADCARLSPGGDRHASFSKLVLLFTPESVRVHVELTPSHAPSTRLGRPDARLSLSSWLGGRGTPIPVLMKLEPSSQVEESHAH